MLTDFLLRNDPLDAVWRESEKSLDLARKARYQDVAAVIVSQQRFIATMQGRTATFSTFSDAQFDEAAFEAQLAGNRTPTMILLLLDPQAEGAVPVRRLRRGARGSRQGEGAALGLNRPVSSCSTTLYYAALTVAALYENGSADEQKGGATLLTAHRGTTARMGRKLSADFRRQARTGVGRDRPPGRARRRRDALCTKRPFDRLASTASCRTRGWPMKLAVAVLRRARIRENRARLSARRPALLSPLGRRGKVRQLEDVTRTPRGRGLDVTRLDHRHAHRAAGRRDGGQGFPGGVG